MTEPRGADDTLPLLLLPSSSVLLPRLEGNRAFLLPKLLLYRWMGAGLGELDAEEVTVASGGGNPGVRRACCGSALIEERLLLCDGSVMPMLRPDELPGELEICSPPAGDEDNDPALNGWKDTDGRRGTGEGIVSDRGEAREEDIVRWGNALPGTSSVRSSSALGILAHGLYRES